MGWRAAIYILLAVLACGRVCGQPAQYRFKRLDNNHGLSNNYVTCFLKDSKSFLWVGTISGLNRYDGYSFTIFTHHATDTTTLVHNSISQLCEGPDGKIWITTPQGVNVYDPATERISRNPAPFLHALDIPDGVISSIIRDPGGNYYFVHATAGVFRYDRNRTTTASLPAADPHALVSPIVSLAFDPHNNLWLLHADGLLEHYDTHTRRITYRSDYLKTQHHGAPLPYTLLCDRDGDLWIHVYLDNRGLYFFSAAEQTFAPVGRAPGGVPINTSAVRSVVQDNNGLLWVATDHGGINIVDKKNHTVQYLLHDPLDDKSLGQNTVNTLYRDDQGIIWAGTYKAGISYYHEDFYRFPVYRKNPAAPHGQPYDDINRFAEDARGNLWIATNGGGLLYFDRLKNTFRQYHAPGSDVIVSLYLDRQQVLWIGTYYGGLLSYDGRHFTTYRHHAGDTTSLAHDSVWEIYEDSKGQLWIGTLDGGLDRFDRQRKIFHHYPAGRKNSIHSSYVSEILEDDHGLLWIGTAYGLEVMNPQTRHVTHYLSNLNDPHSLSDNIVHALYRDRANRLWVGTASGLNVFDPATQSFRTFRQEDGLPHNTVLSIAEDSAGNLWLSTPNGLARATVTGTAIPDLRVQVSRYDASDGLQGAHFNENAGARLRSGELVFGGLNGFNIFNPDKITPNAYIPPVVISGFELFNKRIGVGEPVHDGDPVLAQSITETATITLQHHQDFFALQFVALNYLHPEKNQYQYRLEGFNKDWITADPHTRKATYTNLDPGRYTFRVRASNNDRTWNEVGAAVAIVVEPPFWKSKLAFVLYVILLVAILIAARKVLLLRERANVRLQQERAEAQRMHELDLMKIRFFTNVSHEFRTPLALILAPMEKLTQLADHTHARQFQLIQRNARRLLNLVNQLLDFRKLETQGIPYYPAAGDLVQFVRETTYSFSDLSEKNDIHLSFYTALARLDTLFDPDKLEKILFNLLSNAFKFTPEHGRISVRLDHAPGADDANPGVRICVDDTGIGIPVEKQGRIFERFFQHDLPSGMINQGSGIGLAITREFVKVHGGTISVESEPEKGSRFTILLPLQPIPQASTATPVPFPLAATAPVAIPIPQPQPAVAVPPRDSRKPLLLLVEDNHDFRFYLQDNLREEYTVLEAPHGTEGWRLALETIPDLIVSDVMMPGLSGTDLCRRLKSDERTSHIPVVLLTARSSEEQKREGYDTGANDYIVKPFSVEILQARLRNILRQQEATRKSFQQYLAVKGSSVNITPLDEKLISKAVAMVEANLEDADFSVEALSHELGMSRIHLYRKISSLTGKTPVEFIRSIRLQHAAQLLEKSQLTISEIAYRVGFNNPKYFTRQFKDAYHVLPSEYAMRGVKKGTPFRGGGFAHGVS